MKAERAKELTFNFLASSEVVATINQHIENSANKGLARVILTKEDFPFSSELAAFYKEQGFEVSWGSETWTISWI